MHETTSAPNSTQSDQPASPLAPDLAQRLTGKTVWVQRAISPWTRRWLPSENTEVDGGLQRPMALTAARTTSFLGHIQRAVQTASLWRLDTDTIQPLRYDRFGGAIVARFPDTSERFQPQPAAANPTDLVLAGTGEIEIEPQAAAQQPEGFKPFASLADFKAALAAKEWGESFEVQPQVAAPQQPGVFNKPFASLADFKAALAAKERGESFEVQPQVTAPQQPGVFNKAFASLADFKAALAAKEQATSAATPVQPSAPAEPTVQASTETRSLPQPRSTPPPQIQRLRQPGHPAHPWPPGTRPRARIEEVTPPAETGPTIKPTEGQLPSTNQSEEEFGFIPSVEDQPERDSESTLAAEPPASVQRQPAVEVPPQVSSGSAESAESAQGLTQAGQPPAARQTVEPPPTPAVKTSPQIPGQRQPSPGRSEESTGIKSQGETAAQRLEWPEAESTAQRSSEFEALPVEMATLPQPESKSSPVESPAESEPGQEAPVQRSTAETGPHLPVSQVQAALPAEVSAQQAGEASGSSRAEATPVVQSVEPKMPAAGTQAVAAETPPPGGKETGVRSAQSSPLLQRQAEPEPQTNLSNQTVASEERSPEQKPAGRPAETTSQTEPAHHPPVQPSETTAIQRSVEVELPRQLDAPGTPASLLPAASDEAELLDVSSNLPEFILRREGAPSGSEPSQRDTLSQPAALPRPEAPVQRSIERKVEPAVSSQLQPAPPVKQEPLPPDLGQTKSPPENRSSSSGAAQPKEAPGVVPRPVGFQLDSNPAAVSQTSPPEEPPLSSGREHGLAVQRADSPSPGAASSLPLPRDTEELTLRELPVDRPEPSTLMESAQVLPGEVSTGSLEAPVQRSAEAVERQALVSPTGPSDAMPRVTPLVIPEQSPAEIITPQAATSHSPGEEPLRQGEVPIFLPTRPEQSMPPVQPTTEVEMPLRESSPAGATPKAAVADESPSVATETLPRENEGLEEASVSIPAKSEQVAPPPVQRTTEVEMPLRESSPTGATPKFAVSEPAALSLEAGTGQIPSSAETLPREIEGSEEASVSIPAKSEQAVPPPVQRTTEVEMPLRESSPAGATPKAVADESPSMATETLPRENEVSEEASVSVPAKSEQAAPPPVQRTTEVEMPLRESSPAGATPKAAVADEPPSMATETLPRENEVSEEALVSIPARPEQSMPPIQRTTEVEMPLRESSPAGANESPSVATETLPRENEVSEEAPVSIPAKSEQAAPPPVQRTTEVEMPLRKSSPAGPTPKFAADESPSMATETLPRENERLEEASVSIPAKSEQAAPPSVQRTTEVKMPLQESSPAGATPKFAVSEPAALSLEAGAGQIPSSAETLPREIEGSEEAPVSIPAKSEQATPLPVQRTTEVKMSLRESSPAGPTPKFAADESPSMATETLPREIEGSEEAPVSIPAKSEQAAPPPVQRTTEVEMPLRESSPAGVTPKAAVADESPLVATETLPRENEVSEEASVSIPAKSEQAAPPPVQRTTEVEMPLRESSPAGPTPKFAADEPPSMATETLPRENEVSEEAPVSILAKSEQAASPPVQRTTEVEMPLREPRRAEPQPLDAGQGQPVPNLKDTEQAGPLSSVQPGTTALSGENSGPLVSQRGMVEPPPGLTGQAIGTNIQQSREEAVKMPLRWQPPLQRQPDDVSAVGESAQGGSLDENILGQGISRADLPLVAAGPMSQNRLDVTRKQPPMPALPQARGWTIQTEADTDIGEIFEPTPLVTGPTRRDPHSAEGVAMPLAAPIRIETRREGVATPLDMPLPVTPSSPTPVVQRQPVKPEPALSRIETVPAAIAAPVGRSIQRAEDGGTVESDTMAGAELDKLAREIYPLIKRMLAVERERRPIR